MKTKTFTGGVHPPERKELTEHCATEMVMPFTKTVIIPITQGGAPNSPIVKVGDAVIRGQKIAESEAYMSVPVHASVSGTVKKIEYRVVTGNVESPCITIEGNDSTETAFLPPLDPFSCSKDEALKRVREAGIVGMGGAAFPTHVKLNPPAGKIVDTILANGAECEPYLTIDYRLMLEQPSDVIDGLAIVRHITGAKEGILVLEDNKADLLPALEKTIAETGQKNLRVQLVKTKYPQGGEKMLVKAVLNREIPSGGLPADAGCVIQNVGTLAAVSEAFRLGKPLVDRAFTVSGDVCETPKNVKVPIGTLVGDLIPTNIKLKPGVTKIIAGGPMMGIAMSSANFPVQKNTSGVLFLSKKEASIAEEDACLGCARCVQFCSCRLTPVMIVRSLKADDLDAANRYGLMDCVECGSCAYVCPARIKLVQRFRLGKQLYRVEMQRRAQIEKANQGGNT